MTEYQKPQPKDLPCIFANLVDIYANDDLKPCATKRSQKWRHASSKAAAERLLVYHNYIPELIPLYSSLNSYSICEVHYNQVICTNKFYQNLSGLNIEDTSAIKKKRSREGNILEIHSSTSSKNVDKDYIDTVSPIVQFTEEKISNDDFVSIEEFRRTRYMLELCEQECKQKSQLITDLNNQITRQSHQLEDQNHEIDDLKKRLIEAQVKNNVPYEQWNSHIGQLSHQLKAQTDEIIDLKKELVDSYNKLIEAEDRNKVLVEQWNSRFSNQQKRIDSIIEIAIAERDSLFDDVESLIRNDCRFSLENLVNYTPEIWLNERNQVIVKFIETLTENSYNRDNLNRQKLFKRAIAVDAIYASRHGKYVSEINLAASAIKYSLARSKTVINIDNHITSGGSYFYFQKWLEELSDMEEALPNGLLFIGFDNEQKGQKNYLDRGFNKVIFHIVTSFVAFNMESNNEIQHKDNPWMHNSLSEQQYEELFDFSPEMQEEIDKELYTYLSEILDLLREEKNNSTNVIDALIENNVSNNGFSKHCRNCNEQNIQNRKKNCPHCKAKLPTLEELQEQNVINDVDTSKDTVKSLIFKSSSFENESNIASTSRISITQQPVPDPGVKVPNIYIPDPLNINPNSIENVETILFHIEKISGIKEGNRKWVAVVCDGVPYHHATKLKIKGKFPWLVLIPGQLHEEMNMLKAYVELNW